MLLSEDLATENVGCQNQALLGSGVVQSSKNTARLDFDTWLWRGTKIQGVRNYLTLWKFHKSCAVVKTVKCLTALLRESRINIQQRLTYPIAQYLQTFLTSLAIIRSFSKFTWKIAEQIIQQMMNHI